MRDERLYGNMTFAKLNKVSKNFQFYSASIEISVMLTILSQTRTILQNTFEKREKRLDVLGVHSE